MSEPDTETVQTFWSPTGGDFGPVCVAFDFERRDDRWKCTAVHIDIVENVAPEGFELSPAILGKIPLGRLARQMRAGIWGKRVVERGFHAWGASEQGVPDDEIEWPKLRKDGALDNRRGRPPLPFERYQAVARVYIDAVQNPGTDEPPRPVEAVMYAFDLKRSTANYQIRRCRQSGLIPPVGDSDSRSPKPQEEEA